MAREQAHQLEAGISGGAEDRGLYGSVHFIVSMQNYFAQCVCASLHRATSGYRVRDRQNGVVAADGAHDFIPLLGIDRRRNRLRAAGAGLDHHLVLRRLHVVHERLN